MRLLVLLPVDYRRAKPLAGLLVLAVVVLCLSGCGEDAYSPAPPSLEWDARKYGPEPAHRPLSTVTISQEPGWIVAREKASAAPSPAADQPAAAPAYCTAHLRIGGMDCGDCPRLVANELGMVVGVRQARISEPDGFANQGSGPSRASLLSKPPQDSSSQAEPEAVVVYDQSKVNPKQIEGTISSLGLWPKQIQ